MSIYQKVNQTKMVKTLFWINFPEGCLSLSNMVFNFNVSIKFTVETITYDSNHVTNSKMA